MKFLSPSDLKGTRMLVVDVIPAKFDILYKTLTAYGYKISIALNGEKALDLTPNFYHI
jgi:hypothetical protein